MKKTTRIIRFFFVKHRGKTSITLLLLFLLYWFSLPSPLFNDPTCMVLEASNGDLLGARIATDGQWRFPFNEQVPEKFSKAIIEFEDRRFYVHPGFDPLAFSRAMVQNIRSGSVVSGGSTLSMQVIRLARKGKDRTVFEKIIEVILATRLEIRYSKKEILALYASNAPFGGNVVGVDAASWRYFAKSSQNLSWSEAATLAVLPNSPALIHPGRNRDRLLKKRNRLLEQLYYEKIIDRVTLELSTEEPLPEKPHPLPRLAPHLLERVYAELFRSTPGAKTKLRTTVDLSLQQRLLQLAARRTTILKNNEINNLAILVLEVETGNVLAYIGNAPGTGEDHGESVDIIKAPRSTGSIMKPLLYAMMLQDGQILPNSLIPDIPTQLGGYRPENYLETYDGVVSAKMAVARSLNVPFVRMLQNYGLEKFHFNLKKLGLTTLNKPPAHYGLTLVLGGAEGNLWDLTNVYAYMARTLGHFYSYNGMYHPHDLKKANYELKQESTVSAGKNLQKNPIFCSADAVWFAFEAMEELERPTSEGDWQRFESGNKIAWKTGTSFGFRDAWAIGVTPKYAVGIWVGNADGEGRPGLIGVYTAAPILFDVFDLLPRSIWFNPPYDAMKKVVVCKKSGYLSLDICEKDTIWATGNSLNAPPCPYHQMIALDKSGKWRVSADCMNPLDILLTPWFVLPPVEEYYYKTKTPDYKLLPPFLKGCGNQEESHNPLQIIYPKVSTKIYVPVELDGKLSKTVFKATHRKPQAIIHWHIDQEYIGSTKTFHEIELSPLAGKHLLTLVDESGNRLQTEFEILEKK
jgi:penicillin-binding protein 1C